MFKKKNKDIDVEAKKTSLYIDEAEAAAYAAKMAKKKFYLRIVKIVVALFTIFLLGFLIIKVGFAESSTIAFSDEGIKSDVQVSSPLKDKGINGQMLGDEGLTVIAQNEFLTMSYSPKEDLFIFKDNKTGEQFRSYPEPIYGTEEKPEQSDIDIFQKGTPTGNIITSPVFIGYTKMSGRDGGLFVGVNTQEHVKNVYYIENGIRLTYEMIELELEFSVEITIDGNEVVYFIPKNGIIERPYLSDNEEDHAVEERPLLSSIAILPYLFAHRSGDSGYFVVPDGSGAVTDFSVSRIGNSSEYAKRIYGWDYTIDSVTDAESQPRYNNHNILLGAYGIIENLSEDANDVNKYANSMITGFIEQGDANAYLRVSNPGVRNVPFYAIYVQYTYREYFNRQVSKTGSSYSDITRTMQLGDVKQRITFELSSDKDYHYSDLAKSVQNKIIAQWKERFNVDVTVGNIEDFDVLNLRTFMGAENVTGGLAEQLKVMTTFKDAQNIYNDLKNKGMSDVSLTMVGWMNHGYFWNATSKLKPDSEFEDDMDMEEFNKWAEENGVNVNYDNNLLFLYGSPKGSATLRSSVVKIPSTFYLTYRLKTVSGAFYRGGNGYLISPVYYESKILSDNIERLEEYGVSGVALQQIGDQLYSDYNQFNAIFRIQLINSYVDWLIEYGENFEKVSVYNGNSYVVPFVSSILDMSMTKSSHVVLDEQIPFVQMIYHGIVPYYSKAINNCDVEYYSLLKSIEYGALGSIEVTEEESALLKWTYYDTLYKSEYDLLSELGTIDMVYKAIEEAVAPFINESIVNHYKLSDKLDVYCTEYSDGSKVYVCYETEAVEVSDPYTNETITFEGQGYSVKNAKGE